MNLGVMRATALILGVCLAVCARSVPAAETNDRPIRLIVPFAPGGASDVLGRIIAQHLTETMKRQVIVDNRAGAGGNIGMGIAAKATPDGSVMSIASSAFTVNPSLYEQIPYDAVKDFAPITNVASASTVLVVHPSVPAKSVKELVALIKASPGKYNYASSGAGTGTPFGSSTLFWARYRRDRPPLGAGRPVMPARRREPAIRPSCPGASPGRPGSCRRDVWPASAC